MVANISVHIDRATTSISPNTTNSGIVIRPNDRENPSLDLYFGTTPNEVRRNLIHLLDALDELDENIDTPVEAPA